MIKRTALLLAIFLLEFGGLTVAAEESNSQIEKAIIKLERAQRLLERGNTGEAYDMLGEAKVHLSEARFSLLTPTEQEKKIQADKWLIDIENLYTEYHPEREKVYIQLETKVENLTTHDSGAQLLIFIVDPDGVQRKSTVWSSGQILAGAIKEFTTTLLRIDKSELIHGRYTIIFKNAPFPPDIDRRFKFQLDVTEEYSGEKK